MPKLMSWHVRLHRTPEQLSNVAGAMLHDVADAAQARDELGKLRVSGRKDATKRLKQGEQLAIVHLACPEQDPSNTLNVEDQSTLVVRHRAHCVEPCEQVVDALTAIPLELEELRNRLQASLFPKPGLAF